MSKAISVKSPKGKGLSKAQTQEGQARRRIEQYHEDKALEEALGLSLSEIHDTETHPMPTYNIAYFNEKPVKIEEENIFMKNLKAAKRSASHHAHSDTRYIEIKDLMERTLTRNDEGNG